MTAPNMEAPGEVGTEGRAQGTVAADILADADRKRFEYLRALLALHKGHAVHRLADGGYLVCWKGLHRECRDLAELEAFVCRVGAMR